jgi:uncharacterized damage-inducible protein DinB
VRAIELIKHEAEFAFKELTTAIEGVTQGQAWSVLPNNGPDYLHTAGSIQNVVLHVASCKRMYGSIGFRSTELRWRDCADQLDAIEPSWPAAVEYLHDAHRYWLSTWENLKDEDLENEVPHFRGKLWPAWKILRVMAHHDGWHGGQVVMLRYALGETDVPPPKEADDIRQSCKDLASF